MWAWLYQLASPRSFYKMTASWPKKLGFFAFLFLSIGLIWGLVFAPLDYQQGDAFRIIYIHVPAAFMSMALYAYMGFLALLLLVWRIKMAGLMIGLVSQIGASMTLIALVTGGLWGKPMWGTWWVWDARLTSELILLLLYLAILATKSSFKNKEQGDKLIAILALVGLVDLPIIHYSVYWWNSLHQGSTLTVFAKPKIALTMLYPLLLSLLGFAFYSAWVLIKNARLEVLQRDYRQNWVKKMIGENA